MKALVMGGTGCIGEAIAEKLYGCYVSTTVESIGKNEIDLNDKQSIRHFFYEHGNSYDILVYSAGINLPRSLDCLTDEAISTTMNVNALGFVEMVRQCVPYWKETGGGKVVAIASLYSFLSRIHRLPYTMSKHALLGAVKSLALELAPDNVLINAVSPGFIETKMTISNNSAEQIKHLEKNIPLGRLGDVDEVAELVAFLCSRFNTYITGQNFVIDGGYSIGGFQNE